MKKIFTIFFLLAIGGLHAQTYNNEWIDYSKTYYKFKIAASGLYRIPQTVINTAGLGATPAQNFQLFRNGVEIPIYTSIATGPLGGSDYIEFYAEINDGKPDVPLYYNPAYQHTKKWSLETDTAVYFLTSNPSGTAFHYNNALNDTTGTLLSVEPYFIHKTGTYYKFRINPGFASALPEYVFSSSYDIGEFWSSDDIYGGSSLSDYQTNLAVYTGGPAATFSFGLAGCAPNGRSARVTVNSTVVTDTTMDNFNDLKGTVSLPLSALSGNAATITYFNRSAVGSDRMCASYYEISYPRQFDFGGASNFYFELAAKAGGYFLKIYNFNGGAAPVLYDITNGARYTAIVSSGGILSFVLPGSASARKMILVNEDASNIQPVTSLALKTFVNYATSANQGNYLIISNPVLYTGTNGNNPVADYRNYRNSLAGGGYNSIIVDINELVDQFGFGIRKHPLSIKNFLAYARHQFAVKPQFAFLIGHGITYDQYRMNEGNPLCEQLNLVPTFGFPASDNKLSSADGVQVMPLTPIGRLSVVSGSEIEVYLQKVKEYEQVQQTSPNTVDGRLWMKNVLQVTGASDPYLGAVLCNYMTSYQQIMQDTLFGASEVTICNGNVEVGDIANEQLIKSLFAKGLSIINYFGHSSASTLQDNLDDPSNYNNTGKYPVFYANGCDAGNFFLLDPGRVANNKTLSEGWVLAKEKGAIAFVASTHFGIVNYLNILLTGMFKFEAGKDYGKSIGVTQADAVQNLVTAAPGDYYARLHAEEMTLHGDPALKLNTEALPDYEVEASQVVISPTFISIADNSFTVNAHFANLGKAVADSIVVQVKRQFPDGTSTILLQKKIAGIKYEDSILLNVPIIATRDKGQNYITVTINSTNTVSEVTLLNNSITQSVYIYEDEATPIYPYDLAIINKPVQHLFASTANPFSPTTQYVMQIDTTTAFNSPRMVSKFVTSIGGVLEFDPGMSYLDSTVYYWRTSIVPGQNGQYHWDNASFIYIDSPTSSPGFNQSHYFQHLQTKGDSILMNTGRKWQFGTHFNNLYVRQAIYPTGGTEDQDFSVATNGVLSIESACVGQSLIFNVFDPVTFAPLSDADVNGNPLYRFGSAGACGPTTVSDFEYSYMDPADRKLAMNFMDSIPNGSYVVVRSIDYDYNNSFAKTWQGDTTLFGSNNSLYHKLLNAGFTQIDSINQPRAWALVYKKGDPSFTPIAKFTLGIYDRIVISADCAVPDSRGYITSPKFGPAKQWKQLHWRGSSLESPSTDSVGLQVLGLDTAGNSAVLYNLPLGTQDFDISTVNPLQYPYLQLRLGMMDTVHVTPYQLKYWRLNYVPVPEGAVAPNLYFKSQDTLALGQPLQFAVAFKNVSLASFDSMRINLSVIDHNNVTHLIQLPRKKPLLSGDTLIVNYDVDTKAYSGLNTLYLEVNPANDQPEEYHFNNFLYKNFYVKSDNTKPLLDVTFDGVHILNQDIVSAKPHITIKLKDESKFLLLTDTSTMNVQLRYPDGTLHTYNFSTDTLRFTPASSTSDNTATVDFYPAFTQQYNPEGDVYTLIVTGKDASGNPAGLTSYQVSFTVITKAMISNMLNYPNPFTTSTAFVFTITGSQVPQNIKIQILTITGKIVKEITEDELGALHVGRNITEYKWNGTDMYGSRLANGVYIYHVVTNLNGKSLDIYKAEGDNTSQYFVKGYGKMYLMR